MSFLRFLGSHPGETTPAPSAVDQETEAVRRIVSRLATLPPEQARLLAGMAYVLARAAYADLSISDAETQAMEDELVGSGLDVAQAVLVVEMAKLQELTAGGTSDYLVTREFREHTSMEQRLTVMRACFRVASADDSISGTESATLDEIASELDLSHEDYTPIRAEFADKFSARLGFGTGRE